MKKLLIILLLLPNVAFAHISPQELLTCTNSFRTENVKLDPILSYVARIRARDMVVNDYFAHKNPITGLGAGNILDKIEYNWKRGGENLARRFKNADDVCRAWMDSPTHKDNILGDYERVGFAVRGDLVVQIFSTP